MMTSKHNDAIGDLNDLATEVDEQWFRMVCDLAVVTGSTTLDQQDRDGLLALLTNTASYLGIKPGTAAASVTKAIPTLPARMCRVKAAPPENVTPHPEVGQYQDSEHDDFDESLERRMHGKIPRAHPGEEGARAMDE